MPVRIVSAVCPYCEEETLQKQVYEQADHGSVVIYLATCTNCNKDI